MKNIDENFRFVDIKSCDVTEEGSFSWQFDDLTLLNEALLKPIG